MGQGTSPLGIIGGKPDWVKRSEGKALNYSMKIIFIFILKKVGHLTYFTLFPLHMQIPLSGGERGDRGEGVGC
jgi:hypothetical protein